MIMLSEAQHVHCAYTTCCMPFRLAHEPHQLAVAGHDASAFDSFDLPVTCLQVRQVGHETFIRLDKVMPTIRRDAARAAAAGSEPIAPVVAHQAPNHEVAVDQAHAEPGGQRDRNGNQGGRRERGEGGGRDRGRDRDRARQRNRKVGSGRSVCVPPQGRASCVGVVVGVYM